MVSMKGTLLSEGNNEKLFYKQFITFMYQKDSKEEKFLLPIKSNVKFCVFSKRSSVNGINVRLYEIHIKGKLRYLITFLYMSSEL